MAKTRHKRSVREKPPDQAEPVSRRTFLKGVAIGAGVLAITGGVGTVGMQWLYGPAYHPRFLTRAQFETLQAACERILPADADPGAKAIGAAIYMDRLLAEDSYTGDFLRYRPILTKGLDSLEAASKAKHDREFARLGAGLQDTLLGEGANPEFLSTLVEATLDGALYDPFYGGNRDGMG